MQVNRYLGNLVVAAFVLAFSACAYASDAPGDVVAKRIPIIDTHVHLSRNSKEILSLKLGSALSIMDEFGVVQSIVLPPPFDPGNRAMYGQRELSALVLTNPVRSQFVAGGESLNPMIHAISPEKVTPHHVEQFHKEVSAIVQAGASGFGEITAEHFSSGRGSHPYESTRPDHPLMLLLADASARHSMPIDLHMEAVPYDMEMPERRRGGENPTQLKENISAFERLLAHNRNAMIVWAHAGWDLSGERSVELMRELLSKHPNLFMSLKVDGSGFSRSSPMNSEGRIRSNWLVLFKDFPDRFVVGSDQFVGETVDRLANVRKLVNALPPDLAEKFANINARRIYRLAR